MTEIPKFFKTIYWYIFDTMDIEEHTINWKNVKLFYDSQDSLFWVLIDNQYDSWLFKTINYHNSKKLFLDGKEWKELNLELYNLISNYR